MPFASALMRNKTQTASFRIWTQVADSISSHKKIPSDRDYSYHFCPYAIAKAWIQLSLLIPRKGLQRAFLLWYLICFSPKSKITVLSIVSLEKLSFYKLKIKAITLKEGIPMFNCRQIYEHGHTYSNIYIYIYIYIYTHASILTCTHTHIHAFTYKCVQ